ncbi:aspartyl/asparaginyl beta-hydroxylase domain-containing protein [Micromonospora sp. NPDC049559]|uniref:aspartyl/asparaginyl beta-hydroxylase domain-containing protein n=1 Tax=Micromonospora sp. NPDC049559 TaxID=3155923 RepID=UPI003441666A
MTALPPPPPTLRGDAAAVRLATDIDPAPLRDDLRAIEQGPWDHQRPYSAGRVGDPIAAGWTCFPLHSPGGRADRTDPGGPGTVRFGATPALARMPSFARLLDRIPGELRAVRLLALDPGASLDEHSDEFIGFGYGQLRLHVPIVTNPDALLFIEGRSYHWRPGELWYANFALPHYLRNGGATRRIHLVVDCMVNDAMVELFPDWFRRNLESIPYVSNRPRLPVDPELEVPPFLLPAVLGKDLLAHVTDAPSGDADGVRTEVTTGPDGPLLRTAEGVECLLVRVGPAEYRFEGWTEERTLDFGALPDRVLLHDRRNWRHRVWECPRLPA